MPSELKIHSSFDPYEAKAFFEKRDWPVTFLDISKVKLIQVPKGAALLCGDGRFDNFPELEHPGPRVLGGINVVAAMITGGDKQGFQKAAELVKKLGYEPGTHSADYGGCGYADLWMEDKLRTAVFPYEMNLKSGRLGSTKLGELLNQFIENLGGKHFRLNGHHIEEAVRLNPYLGFTEIATDCKRFRIDDWLLAKLGVPARQRYFKIAEAIEQLKPDAAKLEVIIHPELLNK